MAQDKKVHEVGQDKHIERSYITETRKYKVYCGELIVKLVFKNNNKFHFILVNLDNQNNQCVCAYSEALSNILTFAIRRANNEEMPALLKGLAYQRCAEGLNSCPNAIYKAINERFKNDI